jgi:hypothetical protein
MLKAHGLVKYLTAAIKKSASSFLKADFLDEQKD